LSSHFYLLQLKKELACLAIGLNERANTLLSHKSYTVEDLRLEIERSKLPVPPLGPYNSFVYKNIFISLFTRP